MDIKTKLNHNFVAKVNELREKYGEEFEKINGFHNSNLNFSDFIDNFVNTTTLADATIDSNANNSMKDVSSMIREMSKPHQKLWAFNKIYYEMTKKYGKKYADLWLEKEWSGEYYLHNAHTASYIPYCFAYTLEDIAKRGLFFLGKFKTTPAKHLDTFNNHVLEFISYASNRTSGAVGLADYLIWSFKFYKNDKKSNYLGITDWKKYMRQQFQTFIYNLNQPYLRITESSFTNITIYDREYLVSLFGTKEFEDGDLIIDYIEELIDYQKEFMEVCSEIRSQTMHTFPVLTIALLFQENKFVDEEMARWANKHNMKWYDSNFYIGEDITTLSSCCFDGKQKVLTKGQNVIFDTIENTYNLPYNEFKKNFRIFHNGNWVYGNLNKIKRDNKKMYKVTTVNNKELLMTEDHLSLTPKGNITTEKLTTDDYIAFSTKPLERIPERDMKLTYEQGVFIGAYLGDGSKSKYTTVFSLNDEKISKLIPIFNSAIKQWGFDLDEKHYEKNETCTNIVYHSKELREIIENWVIGNCCNEKELNMECLLQSKDFRNGIIEGLYMTDGGNSNRIYSTSLKQIECIEAVLTSLGIQSIIDVEDRTGEGKVIIRGEEFNRNFPLYCIRFYKADKNIRSMKDIYKYINNTIFFKIKSIEEYISNDDYVYCFEMKNEDEPYFTLPNGVITHNCRVLNNFSEMDKKNESLGFINSIGGTSLKVGSTQVNTTNLMRLAILSEGNFNKYLELLTDNINLSLMLLDVIRGIIKRNIEKGLLPIYDYGLIELNRQFVTIGLTAMYSVIEYFGGIGEDEFGNKFYKQEGIDMASTILDRVNEIKDNFKCDYSINVEIIPGETSNTKLCRKDNLLFGFDKIKTNMYPNQWIPLTEKCTNVEKIKMSSILDRKCGGGQIGHYNLESGFATEEQSWEMLNYIAKQGVIYFAYNIKISSCEDNHAFFGDKCWCGKEKTETYSRIVGFLVPYSSFSSERKQEFTNRLWYEV